MNHQPIVIERTYNVPIHKVWKAITNNDQMKQWYFNLADFKPEVGFEFSFYAGEKDVKYLHHCRITEVLDGKKIAYTWRYEGMGGNSLVTFELFEEGDKTRLRLTHEGTETFITGDPNFAKESFTKGWTYIVGTALENYLQKL